MSVDYPRAWEIAWDSLFVEHNPACSFRESKGSVLCDCEVLTEHPEYTDNVLQTAGGAVYEPAAAPSAAPGVEEG
jgi:hypothetical protein